MAGKTLKELAFLISMSPDELIARLSRLGAEVDENTVLTDDQKKLLLSASKEGPSKKTIQVKKKSLSDTKASGRLTIKVKNLFNNEIFPNSPKIPSQAFILFKC